MSQNSANQDYTNNTDGAQLGGGTTKRILKWSGADITLVGSGTNTYTFPSATDTLVGRTSTDTLTHKTITDTTNSVSYATFTNPYKFSAYRNAAQNSGNGAFAIINFDTKVYDTGTNFDVTTNKGRFTAPVAGFYQFNARASASSTLQFLIALYKNGSVYRRGSHNLGSGTYGVVYNDIVQASANDYFEIYSFGTGGALEVGATTVWFSGFLVSTT